MPDDVTSFLAACRKDRVEVLGWELWIVDHAWGADFNGPLSTPGLWCGGIPVNGHAIPAVFAFDVDADEAERQLASLELAREVQPDWLLHVRVNFTMAD